MKKLIAFLLAISLCLTFIGCGKTAPDVTEREEGMPDKPNVQVPCVVYQGVLYCTTGELILDVDVDESMIIGEITSVVDMTELPTKDGEANFGQVGMPYALVSEGLAVRIDNFWRLFVKANW